MWFGLCGFAGGWFGELLTGKASHAIPIVVVRESGDDCSQEVIVIVGADCVYPWTSLCIGGAVFGGLGIYVGWKTGRLWRGAAVKRTYIEPAVIDELEDSRLSRQRPGFGSLPVARPSSQQAFQGLSFLDSPSVSGGSSIRGDEVVWRPRARK